MKLARPVIVPMPLPGDLAFMLAELSLDFEVVIADCILVGEVVDECEAMTNGRMNECAHASLREYALFLIAESLWHLEPPYVTEDALPRTLKRLATPTV